MKIYFLSSKPCALTLNGVFFGVTDSFERFAELNLSDRVYAQFSPEGELPIGFFITEELTSSPPSGCEVYLVKEGVAIYACDFPPADFTLQPIAQLREGEVLATLFKQGKLQLCVESPKGYFNATLPPAFASCSIEYHRGVLLLKSPTHLGVYTLDCKPMLIERAQEVAVEGDRLNAVLPLSDSLRRTAECKWRLTDEACVLTELSLKQSASAPPHGLIAYAFFESVLIKGDYAAFLSEELRPDVENIVEFLGEFIAVTTTEKETECGLVRKKGERLFVVEYYSVEIANGKITDVKG